MKKLIAMVLVCVLAAVMFAGCGNKNNKLSIATNAEFEPFESIVDGEYVGFDVELLQAIAGKMGKEIKWENMEFESVLAAVVSKSSDLGVSGLTINDKRKAQVNFSTPYYTVAQNLIVKADDTHFTGTSKEALDEQLKNTKIGACAGYTGEYYAKGDADWDFTPIEGIQVKVYDNVSLALVDLKNGEIDSIIMDDAVANAAVNAEANKGLFKVINVGLTVEDYGIALNKDNAQLLADVNKAIADLKADGTLDSLIKKWLAPSAE